MSLPASSSLRRLAYAAAATALLGRLLGRLGFSLQANRKTREGTQHPDRNAQFEHINATVADFQAAGEPAISVDTKKKELVGDFKNGGRELRPKGRPEAVRVHDFVIPALGKAVPYGVYDIAANAGAALRLAACLEVPLLVIEPCGFVWDDRRLRRAGRRAAHRARGRAYGVAHGVAGAAAADGGAERGHLRCGCRR